MLRTIVCQSGLSNSNLILGDMTKEDTPVVINGLVEDLNKLKLKSNKCRIQEKGNSPSPSFLKLFRYASPLELFLLFVGIFFGILTGCFMPFIIIFYGEYTTLLIERSFPNKTVSPTLITALFKGGRQANGTIEDNRAAIIEDALAFGVGFSVFALFQFSVSFICVTCLNYSALLQTARLRREFLKSFLRQEMSWYDCNNVTSFPTKMIEGLDKIQEGIGEKIGIFLSLVVEFITSVTLAFFYGWKLTLVMLTCTPILIASNALICKVQTSLKEKEMEAYGQAGCVAEEVFSNIKTVMAFNGKKKEIERYHKELEYSQMAGIRKGYLSGIGGGVSWFLTYSCYALAFWYGVSLIIESREANNFEYTPAVLLIVFFGVLVGAIRLGQSTPHLEAFATARAASTTLFSVLDRKSKIDPLSTDGRTLSNIKGEIKFTNVCFRYPARQEMEVLKRVNITIKSGEKVALVGASGSGKSTIIQLLQRFYDPTEGYVEIDNVNLCDLNVSWIRQQIGLVQQEPSLFATTIYENIRHGCDSATKEDIEEAAKRANAHDFIMKLPDGYQTVLGAKGSLISGGQKQRIAIARTLIRNPKILLLDEATSALDATSENKIQEALDVAAQGRTTLIVTHKLSTIAKTDRIIVLSGGQVIEEGSYEELVNLKGEFFKFLEMEKRNEEGLKDKREEKEINDATDKLMKDSEATEKGGTEFLAIANEKTVGKDSADEQKSILEASVVKILKYNKSEWWAILLGVLSTIIISTNVPLFSILFAELYGVLSNSNTDFVTESTAYYSGLLLGLGIIVGIATFLQSYMLNYAGVKLTSRFRKLGFAAILNQEAGWFDYKANSTGILCAKLSSDAADIQGATASRVGVLIQSFGSIFSGVLLGFLYSWKMTVVTSLAAPLVFCGMYFEAKIIQGQSVLEKSAIEKATKISLEAITNIRTVTSLGRETYFLQLYDKALLDGETGMKFKSKIRGLVFALGASSAYISYAVALSYGGLLIADGDIHYKDVIKVSEAILFGMWVLGQSLAFVPNFTQAKISAARMFQLLERVPKQQDGNTEKDEKWKTDGRIKVEDITFAYPTRPESIVLKNLSLSISKGASVAFVGPSGCGKSTVIQLLQRFYDPCEGKIYLDDHDISSLKMSTLRHQFGIVSQEPILFDRTIAENIAYGDNSRTVSESEIINAAKNANVHDFIVSLPLGYETRAGVGGSQLSGGQKQRIAIARALIRNPKVLLLDEATSALDAASESVVQAALDKASSGRTTITVGHRVGAIKRADIVYHLDRGQVRRVSGLENVTNSGSKQEL